MELLLKPGVLPSVQLDLCSIDLLEGHSCFGLYCIPLFLTIDSFHRDLGATLYQGKSASLMLLPASHRFPLP